MNELSQIIVRQANLVLWLLSSPYIFSVDCFHLHILLLFIFFYDRSHFLFKNFIFSMRFIFLIISPVLCVYEITFTFVYVCEVICLVSRESLWRLRDKRWATICQIESHVIIAHTQPFNNVRKLRLPIVLCRTTIGSVVSIFQFFYPIYKRLLNLPTLNNWPGHSRFFRQLGN